MRGRTAIFAAAAVALAAGIGALAAAADDEGGGRVIWRQEEGIPGTPHVKVVSPRNGSRHSGRAVAVKVEVENFQMAPRRFGRDPRLGEGHIRFALKRVPDCVEPEKLQRALESPLGSGRLTGRSFDFPRYAGPNGVLARRIGVAGLYSPATKPEIYYSDLPPGFYRLIITLAQNDGATTPFNAVTNFEVLPGDEDKELPKCPEGKVSSTQAAKAVR